MSFFFEPHYRVSGFLGSHSPCPWGEAAGSRCPASAKRPGGVWCQPESAEVNRGVVAPTSQIGKLRPEGPYAASAPLHALNKESGSGVQSWHLHFWR